LGEEFVHVKHSIMGIDDDFLVTGFKIQLEDRTVELQLSSIDSGAYSWNASQEDEAPPSATGIVSSAGDPIGGSPGGNIGGSQGGNAVIAPSNTGAAPAVSGSTTTGSVLTCSTGTWSGDPTITYAYQWKWADTNTNISGATSSTYTIVSGDIGHTIKCDVTASNGGGSVSASSNTTAAVTAAAGGPAVHWNSGDKASSLNLTNSLLTATGTAEAHALVRANVSLSSGFRYCEITIDALTTSGSAGGVGVGNSSVSLSGYLGGDHTNGSGWFGDGYVAGPGFEGSTGETYGASNVIGVLVDFGSSIIQFSKDGVVKQVRSLPSGGNLFPMCNSRHIGDQFTLNAGSSPLLYMPTGYTSWDGTQTGPSGGGGATMPSGAVGIWYVDQYSSSPSGIQNATGSTALTTAGTSDGNMYLSGGTAPSGGALDFNSGEHGNVSLPSSVLFTEGTVIYSCHKESNGTGEHYIIADSGNYHFWSAGENPGFQNSSTFMPGQQSGDLWDRLGAGWHISSHAYDTSSAESWIDGVKVLSKSASPNSHTIGGFDIGVVNGTVQAGYKINALAVYNRKLSATEQVAAYNAFKARAALSSITIPATSPEKILFAMGDSITDGSYGTSTDPGYVYVAARNASPVIRGGNLGIGGKTVATTDADFDATYGPMISAAVAASGRDIICSLSLGTNDLGIYSGGVSAWLTAFAALCDKVRATGAKLIVGTLQANIDSTFNSRRATANATIRTWVGTHADAIMDFGSDSIMGADATASNTTYFQDGTHPTGAGHALLAPYLVTAINSL
jgi:lysophospholipase L1-like esterase